MLGFIGDHFLYLVLGAQGFFICVMAFVSIEDAARARSATRTVDRKSANATVPPAGLRAQLG